MKRFRAEAALIESLTAQLDAARVPGVVVAAARGADLPSILAYGSDATQRPLDPSSLFPVASITKLATALAVLRLVDAGLLGLDDPLAAHVPEAAAAQAAISLRSLLCHISGMPLDLSSEQVAYAQGLNWAQLAQACLETFPGHAPGEQVQYSNVGYGLLALVVEHTTRMPFPQALEHFVLKPLGIVGTLGGQLAALPVQLADVRGTHAGGPIEPFNSGFWRGLGLPWAGLITDAAGALALVCAFAGTPSGFLRETTRIAATTNQTGGLAGGFAAPMLWPDCPWGLGPELRGQKQPHWAPAGMTESFGHSGASGCLAWADPITDTAWVILGTRTAESGWLLRRGAALSQAILAAL